MVELKDTTLYRPAPSNVSVDVEFSNQRVVHCEGRQSAVTKDLFTGMGPFRIPGRLFLLQRAWLRHSLDFGKRANPPPPPEQLHVGKKVLGRPVPTFWSNGNAPRSKVQSAAMAFAFLLHRLSLYVGLCCLHRPEKIKRIIATILVIIATPLLPLL